MGGVPSKALCRDPRFLYISLPGDLLGAKPQPARVHPTVVGVRLAMALGGCSVSGPPFEKLRPPEGKSVIYVYRENKVLAHEMRSNVSCDDARSIPLGPGASSSTTFNVRNGRPLP
jgi:hypothetical protein